MHRLFPFARFLVAASLVSVLAFALFLICAKLIMPRRTFSANELAFHLVNGLRYFLIPAVAGAGIQEIVFTAVRRSRGFRIPIVIYIGIGMAGALIAAAIVSAITFGGLIYPVLALIPWPFVGFVTHQYMGGRL